MTIGKIGEFKVTGDDWNLYVERLEHYFLANGVKNELRVSTLITVMGSESYELLVNLCTPDKPSTKTFEQLTVIMQKHLQPKPSVLAERYKFRQRKQQKEESIAEYVTALKKLSKTCEFGSWLEESIRDQFVCGINSDIIRQRLFAEDKLDYKKAYVLAVSLEAAERDAAAVEGHAGTVMGTKVTECHAMTGPRRRYDVSNSKMPAVQRATPRPAHSQPGEKAEYAGNKAGGRGHSSWAASAPAERAQPQQCEACGGAHRVTVCKFKRYVCRVCNRQGHLRRMCPYLLQQHKVEETSCSTSADTMSEDSDELL